MTPERRREVGERLKLYKSGTPCKPQAAFAEVLRLLGETIADNDTLTAENERLKAEVERLKPHDDWDGERCREGCGRNQRIAWSVLDKVWSDVTGGLKNVLCLECFLKLCQNKGYDLRVTDFQFLSIGGARLIDSVSDAPDYATLRTHLKALVTAGEKGIEAYCALCDVLSDLPTCIEDIVEDYQMHSDAIDALSAAVREAKGEE